LASQDVNSIDIYKDGALVSNCTGKAGTASPNPCVLSRQRLPDDGGGQDGEVTVLTASASSWCAVVPKTSVIWATPASVPVGTALSNLQLNATANVPGTFVYTPASGTLMSTAGNQTLSVTFTPNDTVNYTTVTKTVMLNVVAAGTATMTSSLGGIESDASIQ